MVPIKRSNATSSTASIQSEVRFEFFRTWKATRNSNTKNVIARSQPHSDREKRKGGLDEICSIGEIRVEKGKLDVSGDSGNASIATRHPLQPPIYSSLELFVRIFRASFLYPFMVRQQEGVGAEQDAVRARARAMKLLINGGVDMKYRTLTYRVSVMYS